MKKTIDPKSNQHAQHTKTDYDFGESLHCANIYMVKQSELIFYCRFCSQDFKKFLDILHHFINEHNFEPHLQAANIETPYENSDKELDWHDYSSSSNDTTSKESSIETGILHEETIDEDRNNKESIFQKTEKTSLEENKFSYEFKEEELDDISDLWSATQCNEYFETTTIEMDEPSLEHDMQHIERKIESTTEREEEKQVESDTEDDLCASSTQDEDGVVPLKTLDGEKEEFKYKKLDKGKMQNKNYTKTEHSVLKPRRKRINDSDELIGKATDGMFFCKLCDRRSNTKRQIKDHLASHREERNYICDNCNKAFKTSANLAQHRRRHLNKKNVKCLKCPMTFYSRSEMQRHFVRHNNERLHMCSECGQSFYTISLLKDHLKRHTNTRPHKCEVCEKEFYDASGLRYHMLGHKDERKHKCDKCGARFNRKHTLRVHQKIHFNLREFICKICNAAFNQNSSLVSHMKQKHGMRNNTNAYSTDYDTL